MGIGNSVQFSRSILSDSASPGTAACQASHPSPTPGPCSNSCPSSWWCHLTISSSIVPFSSRLQSGSFPLRQFFASHSQSTGASTLALVQWIVICPMNLQDWFPLRLTGLIFLLSKGFSRVFSNTTVQKHQFFSAQFFLWSIHDHFFSSIHDHWKNQSFD